jgi:putative N6-adenine-specific DNA methylase
VKRVPQQRPIRGSDSQEFFVACSLGLEEVLSAELRALGIASVTGRRGGVAFRGTARDAYAACLWLRSAIRVQELIVDAEVRGPDDLYARVAEVDWSRYLDPNMTLAVDATVRDSSMTHSGYAALTVKDAIVDQMRDRYGARPSVDRERPDVPLRLVVRGSEMLLYRDLAGASLHKRGYRPIQVKSPLNESLAAGILLLSGWDRASALADPMCGSGTFPVEAAMLAADIAPGLGRGFPFETWPEFDRAAWRKLLEEARGRQKKSLPFPILGNDRHPGAVGIAEMSARQAGVERMVTFTRGDAAEWKPKGAPAWVFANPPWGERLGEGEDLAGSWKALGNFLHRCPGAAAFVLSGNAELTKFLGLKATRRWPISNGPLECKLLRYDVRKKG